MPPPTTPGASGHHPYAPFVGQDAAAHRTRHCGPASPSQLLERIGLLQTKSPHATPESISKFGSGLFLLVQVVLLLDFVHRWNENWVAKDEQFWYMALLVVSVVCYIATFSFSGSFYFTGSLHLDMTADSTCSSLSSH